MLCFSLFKIGSQFSYKDKIPPNLKANAFITFCAGCVAS